MTSLNMNEIVGEMDIVFVTLDTLRYDVAQSCFLNGRTPHLASFLPPSGWEKRHAPGTFTYPSHSAFFAGFLPNPSDGRKHERLFASRFSGSETTGSNTFVYPEADLVKALHNKGYETICIGGVGFFNQQNEMGNVFPRLFQQSYWDTALGVTNPNSTFEQFTMARKILSGISPEKPVFLFINISALHQPNFFYLPGRQREEGDCIKSHQAALEYIDQQWPILTEAFRTRKKSFHIYCSDHGTCYGEDGYWGHHVAHEKVLTVPYTHFIFK